MYIYYAFSVRGKRILPKQLITGMQIVQVLAPLFSKHVAACERCPIVQFLVGFRWLWDYHRIPCFRNDMLRMFGTFYFTYWVSCSALWRLFNHLAFARSMSAWCCCCSSTSSSSTT